MTLTVEQQLLVEENHNLIYDFANKRNLIIDEYYDILAIGLCKAAPSYDVNKGKFSTLAYQCMENELKVYWKHLQSKKTIPEDKIISYNTSRKVGKNESLKESFINSFADTYSLLDDVIIDNMFCDFFMNLLNDKEKTVINYIINDMTPNEIAIKLQCTVRNIYAIKRRIRKKWNDFNK